MKIQYNKQSISVLDAIGVVRRRKISKIEMVRVGREVGARDGEGRKRMRVYMPLCIVSGVSELTRRDAYSHVV
jgi:hypothetical protein